MLWMKFLLCLDFGVGCIGFFGRNVMKKETFYISFWNEKLQADDDCIRNLHANFHSIFLILWGQLFGVQKILQQTFLHKQLKTLLPYDIGSLVQYSLSNGHQLTRNQKKTLL